MLSSGDLSWSLLPPWHSQYIDCMVLLFPSHPLSCSILHQKPVRSAHAVWCHACPRRGLRSFLLSFAFFTHTSPFLSCFKFFSAMARVAYAMLAFVTFTCYVLVVSATMEENAQEKTYTTPIPPAEAPDGDCPPPPPPPSSPGSCSSWAKAHPSTLPDLMSFITPILNIFSSDGGSSSIQAITSIFGSKITLHQGLTQSGTDGYSALLRQGSAAILNSYSVRDFPYRPVQVKSAFRGALVSQHAASVMATKFENANLGYGSRH